EDVPRQQVCDAVDRMVSDAFEYVAQVAFGIQVVEFRGTYKAVDRSGALAPVVGASEQPVLTTQCDRAERAFGAVVVDLEPRVIAIASECSPARERITDRERKLALLRQLRQGHLPPAAQPLRLGSCTGLAYRCTFIGRSAADLGLDTIEPADPIESFGGDR